MEAAPSPSPPAGSLRRRVAWAAALGYLVLLALMGWQMHRALQAELAAHSEQANRQFTRMFANDNWSRLRPLLMLAAGPAEARSNPNLDEITAIVRRFAAGTELVAVKIFNAQGLAIYASDRSQIGSDRSRSEGFLSAVRGKVATELIHRDTISGFDGEVHGRDLVASYVPIRNEGTVEAVVEVYTDRTLALQSANAIGLKLLGVLAVLGALALLPWLRLVWRLDARWQAAQAQTQALAEEASAQRRQAQAEVVSRQRFLERVSDLLDEPVARAMQAAGQATGQAGTDPMPVTTPDGPSRSAALLPLLQTTHRRVQELRQLIRLDGGTLALSREPFHLGDLLRRAAVQLESEAVLRGGTVLVYVAPAADGRFLGDAGRIEDAVSYLLKLAVCRSEPACAIQLRAQREAGGVIIDVIDGGQAMTPDQLDLLMGALAPALAAPAMPAPPPVPPCEIDHEIALRLVAGLARALGGRLSAQTEAGRGTSVHLWLPLGTDLVVEAA